MKTYRRIHEIDPDRVKVFVHRERTPDDFERIKTDIGKRGQVHPGQVRDIRHLPKEDAEAFTALPATDQAIVMEVFRETKDAQIRELVKRAKAVTEETGKPLSKTALSKSLQRIDEDLKRVREKLKVARLHHALGPGNLLVLLEDRKFRKALEAEGVNIARFEKVNAL